MPQQLKLRVNYSILHVVAAALEPRTTYKLDSDDFKSPSKHLLLCYCSLQGLTLGCSHALGMSVLSNSKNTPKRRDSYYIIMLCFPQVQQQESWPDLHVPTQPLSKPHVQKRSTFLERSKELLRVEDLKQPIIIENYKEMFHKLLCWEEKEHITLLHKRLVS